MSKSEIEKIKSVLAEINEQIGHLQAEKYDPIEDDFKSFYNLTKALEVAVEALYYFDYDELYNGSVNRTDKSTHAEYAQKSLKQISEILGDK